MSLDEKTLQLLSTVMNSENNSSEFDDETYSDFDEYFDDDDEFDEFDEFDDDDDDDYYDDDDEAFAEFDDDDDDEFIGRWLRRRKIRRRKRRDAKLRAALNRVRPIRRPRVRTVNRTAYATKSDLDGFRRTANKGLKNLKRTAAANARATSALRRKMAAAQKQQQMMAMMQMMMPPQIEEIKTDSTKNNTLSAHTTGNKDASVSFESPDVTFKTNPLALLPLMSSGGGMNNMMLPLILMTMNK